MFSIIKKTDAYPTDRHSVDNIEYDILYVSVYRQYIEGLLKNADIYSGFVYFFDTEISLKFNELTYVNIETIEGYIFLLIKNFNNYYIVKYSEFDENCAFCKIAGNVNESDIYNDFYKLAIKEGDNCTEILNPDFMLFPG